MAESQEDLIITDLGDRTFMFEHCDLKGGPYMNFTGVEKQYNRPGDRNFHLILPQDFAEEREEDGWNITWPKVREDLEEEDRYPRVPSVECKVEFQKGRPPKIMIITSANPKGTRLREGNVEMLDSADIANVDLIIRGNKWRSVEEATKGDGTVGPTIKAYLKTMFVTLNEDPLELKYGARGGSVDDDDEFDDD